MSIESEINRTVERFAGMYSNIQGITIATIDGFPISHFGKGDSEIISAVLSQIIDNIKKLDKYEIFPNAKYLAISDDDGNWIYGKLSKFEDMDFCIIMISRNMYGCKSVLEEIAIEIIRIYLRHRRFVK